MSKSQIKKETYAAAQKVAKEVSKRPSLMIFKSTNLGQIRTILTENYYYDYSPKWIENIVHGNMSYKEALKYLRSFRKSLIILGVISEKCHFPIENDILALYCKSKYDEKAFNTEYEEGWMYRERNFRNDLAHDTDAKRYSR